MSHISLICTRPRGLCALPVVVNQAKVPSVGGSPRLRVPPGAPAGAVPAAATHLPSRLASHCSGKVLGSVGPSSDGTASVQPCAHRPRVTGARRGGTRKSPVPFGNARGPRPGWVWVSSCWAGTVSCHPHSNLVQKRSDDLHLVDEETCVTRVRARGPSCGTHRFPGGLTPEQDVRRTGCGARGQPASVQRWQCPLQRGLCGQCGSARPDRLATGSSTGWFSSRSWQETCATKRQDSAHLHRQGVWVTEASVASERPRSNAMGTGRSEHVA